MEAREFLNRLISKPEFQELHQLLTKESFFSILRIDEKELVHTRLLGWLLDPLAGHGMGSQPLQHFLLLCSRRVSEAKSNFNKYKDHNFIDAVAICTTDLAKLQVTTEYRNDLGRNDVFVYSHFVSEGEEFDKPLLLVEYKVNASEGKNQTNRYVEFIEELRSDQEVDSRYPLLIYISPSIGGHTPIEPFVWIGYPDLLGWIDALKEITKTQMGDLLLNEFKCVLDSLLLGANNNRVNILRDELKKHVNEEFRNGPVDWKSVEPDATKAMAEYRKTMSMFGIDFLIPPANVVIELKVLSRDRLDPTKWAVRGKRGLMIHHLGFRQLISRFEKRETKNPRLQISVHGDVITLKFYWNQDAHIMEDSIEKLASTLRNRFVNNPIPNLTVVEQGKTVGRISVSGIDENGITDLVKATDAINNTLIPMDKLLDDWCAGEAMEILQNIYPPDDFVAGQ